MSETVTPELVTFGETPDGHAQPFYELYREAARRAGVTERQQSVTESGMKEFYEKRLVDENGDEIYETCRWFRQADGSVDLRDGLFLVSDESVAVGTPGFRYAELTSPRLAREATEEDNELNLRGLPEVFADMLDTIHAVIEDLFDREEGPVAKIPDEVVFTSHGTLDRPGGLGERELFEQIRDDSSLVVITGWGAHDMGNRIVDQLEPAHLITEGGTLLYSDPTHDEWGNDHHEQLYGDEKKERMVEAFAELLADIRREFEDPVLHSQGNEVGVCLYVNPTPEILGELADVAGADAVGPSGLLTDGRPAPAIERSCVADGVACEAVSPTELEFNPSGAASADDEFHYRVEKVLAEHWTLLPYRILETGTTVRVELLGADRIETSSVELSNLWANPSTDRVAYPKTTYDPVPVPDGPAPPALEDRLTTPETYDCVAPQDDCCVDVFVNSKADAVEENDLLTHLGYDPEHVDISYVSKGTGSDEGLIRQLNAVAKRHDNRFDAWCPSDSPQSIAGMDTVTQFTSAAGPTDLLNRIVKRRKNTRDV